jgi:hypothetical protein
MMARPVAIGGDILSAQRHAIHLKGGQPHRTSAATLNTVSASPPMAVAHAERHLRARSDNH